MAEAWALYLGLNFALSVGIKKVEIELDCQELNRILTIEITNTHPLFVIISDCKHLISKFEAVKIIKIRRERNKCADCLAKEAGKKCLPTKTFAAPPPFVLQHYISDLGNM